MSEMKVLLIKFDLNTMRFITEIESFKKDSERNALHDYYRLIDCNSIDIVNYNDDIAIIVDDEGLLKSNNPIVEITINDSYKHHLAGTLIFAKNHYGDDRISLIGLSDGEIFNLMTTLKLKAIGVTA